MLKLTLLYSQTQHISNSHVEIGKKNNVTISVSISELERSFLMAGNSLHDVLNMTKGYQSEQQTHK